MRCEAAARGVCHHGAAVERVEPIAVAAWFVTAAMSVGVSTDVHAQPVPLSDADADDHAIADALELSPGATCLEHDRVAEQVAGWLEDDRVDPRLAIVIEGDPDQPHTVRFSLHDRDEMLSERVFAPGPSRCDDLHAVVALAIAMAIDATVLEGAGVVPGPAEPEPEPEPEPKPKPEPPPKIAAVPPQPLELPAPRTPWKFRALARALLGVALPPNLGGGGALGFELSFNDWVDVDLSGLGMGGAPVPLEGAEIRTTLAGARLDLCGGPRRFRVRPRGCVAGILGAASARGRAFDDANFRSVVPWVAIAFGGGVRVPLGKRVQLDLFGDAVVTAVRPVFSAREEFEVRRLQALPWVGGMFGVGFVVELGEGRGVLRP